VKEAESSGTQCVSTSVMHSLTVLYFALFIAVNRQISDATVMRSPFWFALICQNWSVSQNVNSHFFFKVSEASAVSTSDGRFAREEKIQFSVKFNSIPYGQSSWSSSV